MFVAPKNLHMQLDMRPDEVLITLGALGLSRVQATPAWSSHIVVHIVGLTRVPANAFVLPMVQIKINKLKNLFYPLFMFYTDFVRFVS